MPGNNHIPNLNLPQHISIGTNASFDNIDFLYTAGGVKLQKSIAVGGARSAPTDYLGSIVYPGEANAFIFTPEGRALRNDEGNFDYEYFLHDHLGNTRVSFNQKGTTLQDNSYYPFGMSLGESLTYTDNTTSENKYLYNGKELQDDFGLGWYDYGARMYDAEVGRFPGIDPKANLFYWVSPYNYAENSPISNIDLWGLQKLFFQEALDKNTNFIQVYNINRQTTGGKRFDVALSRQDKYNVFYYTYTEAFHIEGKHNVFESMKDYNSFKDGYGTFIGVDKSEIEKAFEDGKKAVIAIGILEINDADIKDSEKLVDKTFTLNHEEVGHGMEVLLNGEKTKNNEEGHDFYFGKEDTYSPTAQEVLTSEDYSGTIAKSQVKEIKEIIDKNQPQ